MIPNCLAYASDAKAKGKHIVGILCEYTPRELIMAADAVPVCLCGGSAQMIGPAEEHLPANLCPLIKYGYHVRGQPFLEIMDMVMPRPPATARRRCTS
jgi:benzoyl-CoA reductase/2-hydroxyglutaryl-CoA dehydratase subunit BcrC/BadD/HgdB